MHTHRNPADLLGLGRDPALARLLRACGTDEACITGGASDYDKFLALAAALPLCEGHPLRDSLNATLTAATGLTAPLCPHTAHPHWDAWVETYLYGGKVTDATIPSACPYCTPPVPTVWRENDLTRLPVPTEVKAPDLSAWSAALESALPADDVPALFSLPEDYAFTRPNPYHANLAVGRGDAGNELTHHERDLLVTQALRVWGQAMLKKSWNGMLILRGGEPEAVTALLAYLDTSRALPTLVWIPDDPADAEVVSGLYASVATGVDLSRCSSSEDRERKISAYAAVAPIGRAMVVE